MGERDVFLHCDNCAGQNKNNCMMQYLLWKVITHRHTSITISFLVTGHTKFSPDWCFGLFKRLFRRTKVSCISDIASVAEKSAVCNTAQIVCSEDGNPQVMTYDWSSYLIPHFKRITGIKQYHHFRFSSSHPNQVFLKEHVDTEEIALVINKNNWRPDPTQLPDVLQPRGLSIERQWYLFETIRPFCEVESRNIACPEPEVPNPKRRRTPEIED